MSVSYNKLWKLLIDKNMSKTQLIQAAKITTNAMAKLGKMKASGWKDWLKFAVCLIAR